MPKSLYPELAELLRRRLDVIADHELRETDPDAQLAQLKDVSEQIAALHGNIRDTGIPPRLDHFLANCSFDKALAFVEGES